jgi:hypothetical protein
MNLFFRYLEKLEDSDVDIEEEKMKVVENTYIIPLHLNL